MMLLLMFLTAIGTGTIVYFLMDGPRRRNVVLEVELRRDKKWVRELREQLLVEQRRQNDAGVQLRGEESLHRKRERDFENRLQAFEARFVSYEELSDENRILKADVLNTGLAAARADYLAKANADLGALYWKEYFSNSLRVLRYDNYPKIKLGVRTAFERARVSGAPIDKSDEIQALKELHASYERLVRAKIESEHQAELRQQYREDERRARETQEAEAEAADAEREAAELAQALAEAKGRHTEEIERLKVRLAEAEAARERAVSLAQLTKAGTVYVISNIGSFGHGVFKIGMSRRYDPQERIDELSGASVPFPFDVHMLIKTPDAPKLENAMHRKFRHLQVNRVNPRKEFFRVPIEEIVAAVRENHGEVEYTADAEALQFLQSQTMTEDVAAEVEKTFEDAEAAGAELARV